MSHKKKFNKGALVSTVNIAPKVDIYEKKFLDVMNDFEKRTGFSFSGLVRDTTGGHVNFYSSPADVAGEIDLIALQIKMLADAKRVSYESMLNKVISEVFRGGN